MKRISSSESGHVFKLITHGKSFLSLKAGEIIKGQVLDILPDSCVSMRLKNKVIRAQTAVPVRKGESLLLKVESCSNDIRLRLLKNNGLSESKDARSIMLSALKQLNASKVRAEELVKIRSFVRNIPEDVKARLPGLNILGKFLLNLDGVSGTALKDTLESSGIFFETKLKELLLKNVSEETLRQNIRSWSDEDRNQFEKSIETLIKDDIKVILMRMKNTLKDFKLIQYLQQKKLNPDELALSIDKLLRNLEYYQFQSKLHDALHVFIPLFWKELMDGSMVFKKTVKGPSSNKSYSCRIDLDLKKTGRIISSILMHSDLLYIKVISDNVSFIEVLRKNLSSLEEQLNGLDIQVASLTIKYEHDLPFKVNIEEGFDIVV